jgi:hypothetical protein
MCGYVTTQESTNNIEAVGDGGFVLLVAVSQLSPLD